jgi:LacI family transcriptional regulator
MSRRSTVTIHDVAKSAGVSVSTVSRVLNDKDDVAPETYEKVRGVIREMGYASSLAAKSMRSHKTNVIGLIMPNVGDPFTIEVMKGISRAINDLKYHLVIYTGGSSNLDNWAEHEQHFVSLLNGSITDGMIVVVPTVKTFSTSFPLVAIDPHKESTSFPAVVAANHAGAMAAMEYLLSLGHRRIGFIGGRFELQSAVRRWQGYQDSLRRANIPLDPELIQMGDYTSQLGFSCAQKLLALDDPPTAIFAANDLSALSVLRAAKEAGRRVPHDLSVIGFDNIPEADAAGLTTVDQFMGRMGYVATEMLVSLIQSKPLESNLYKTPTQLIVRDSCQAIANSTTLTEPGLSNRERIETRTMG